MLKGIHLTLLIGPAVPVPVPRVVLDALQSVKVTSRARDTSGFELTFSLSNRSPLHTLFLVAGGASVPFIRVIIVVTVNGTSTVLMDGVMTQHQIAPGNGGSQSTLTVTGEDLTRVMEYIDRTGMPYPAQPVEARVALILAQYAALGMIPMVIPRILFDVPIPTDKIPAQKGNDRAYLVELAREAGHVFYLEPGPKPGMSRAYWGPEVRISPPQPALSTNMDAHTNVESLSFAMQNEEYKLPVLLIQPPALKFPIPIPIPNINPLRPPLALIPPLPTGIEKISVAAKMSAVTAALKGIAESSRNVENVTGNGALNVLRYGRVLLPRRLVGVRGAGTAFNGLYFVESVTHDISRGEYKQQFTLRRSGIVSLTPRVPV